MSLDEFGRPCEFHYDHVLVQETAAIYQFVANNLRPAHGVRTYTKVIRASFLAARPDLDYVTSQRFGKTLLAALRHLFESMVYGDGYVVGVAMLA